MLPWNNNSKSEIYNDIDNIIDSYVQNSGDEELIYQVKDFVYEKINSEIASDRKNNNVVKGNTLDYFSRQAASVFYKIVEKRWNNGKYQLQTINEQMLIPFYEIIKNEFAKINVIDYMNVNNCTLFPIYIGVDTIEKVNFTSKILDITMRNYVLMYLKDDHHFRRELASAVSKRIPDYVERRSQAKIQDELSIKESSSWDEITRNESSEGISNSDIYTSNKYPGMTIQMVESDNELSDIDKYDISVKLLENEELVDRLKKEGISPEDYAEFARQCYNYDDQQNKDLVDDLIKELLESNPGEFEDLREQFILAK